MVPSGDVTSICLCLIAVVHLVLTACSLAATVVLLGLAIDGTRPGDISGMAIIAWRLLSFPIAWPLGKRLFVHGLLGTYPYLLNSALWGYVGLKYYDWKRAR
jgi:hypothetical protein